jgi:hypothetical protein
LDSPSAYVCRLPLPFIHVGTCSIWLGVYAWVRVDTPQSLRSSLPRYSHRYPLLSTALALIANQQTRTISQSRLQVYTGKRHCSRSGVYRYRPKFGPPPASAESTAGRGADKRLDARFDITDLSALILLCPQPAASGGASPCFPLCRSFCPYVRSVHVHVGDDALAVAAGVGNGNFKASMEVVRHSWPSRQWEKKSLKIRASARWADGSVVV